MRAIYFVLSWQSYVVPLYLLLERLRRLARPPPRTRPPELLANEPSGTVPTAEAIPKEMERLPTAVPTAPLPTSAAPAEVPCRLAATADASGVVLEPADEGRAALPWVLPTETTTSKVRGTSSVASSVPVVRTDAASTEVRTGLAVHALGAVPAVVPSPAVKVRVLAEAAGRDAGFGRIRPPAADVGRAVAS